MIGLSKSSLEVFKSCPRCFWLDKNAKVSRPRGIFPSLPKGMDSVMKDYVERQIGAGMPVHYLEGSLANPFADRALLKKFQSWRTFSSIIHTQKRSMKAWGELDDLLAHEDGSVSPWDFKSKATAPEDAVEYSEKYYQLQGDMYDLLLEGQKLKASGWCYFTYTWPVEIQGGSIQFDYVTIRIATSRIRAVEVLSAACECLEGPCPASKADCEYCGFSSKQNAELEVLGV